MMNFFKDTKGNWAVWQTPNLPLITWLFAQALTMLLPHGQANFIAELFAYGTLFTWAWLELFYGLSWFRRTLGAVVLMHLIISRV